MNAHPRMGLGPEMTAKDFAAAGRAEFVRLIIWDMTCSGEAKDPETAQKWFRGRPGIDRETCIQVLQTLFPPRRNASKRLPLRHAPIMAVAANRCS